MSSSTSSEALADLSALRWLIVGADGLIGRHLYAALELAGAQVQGTSRRRGSPHAFFDLNASGEDWRESWRLPEADITIIAAAMTRVEDCEADESLARRINVDAALGIAAQAWSHGGHVVFLSSSGVFDGVSSVPTPNTPPRPLNVYGRQKMEAEYMLQAAAGSRHGLTVIRCTKVLGDDSPILREWQAALGERKVIRPHAWRWMAPVAVAWAVRAILTIAAARAPGVWHLSAADDVNFGVFAEHWAALRGFPVDLVRPKENSEEKHARARLDMRATSDRFAIAPPTLHETLACLRGAVE